MFSSQIYNLFWIDFSRKSGTLKSLLKRSMQKVQPFSGLIMPSSNTFRRSSIPVCKTLHVNYESAWFTLLADSITFSYSWGDKSLKKKLIGLTLVPPLITS